MTRENIDNCITDGQFGYTLLAETVRTNETKCFYLLIGLGADFNHSCGGYVPPLMHAVKYGRREMVKALVAKGADVHYKYSGSFQAAQDQTPLTYAEKYHQAAVADYLRTVKGK